MRQDAHAAAAALPIPGFGHRGAIVALGDARVKLAQIFRHGSNDSFALCKHSLELLFLLGPLRLNLFSFGGNCLLGFSQSGLSELHAPIEFLPGHHNVKLAVFGFGNFGFGVGDFVLQRFEGFVGFYHPALIAVLPGAILPLLYVELKLLALCGALGMGLFRGSEFRARAAELGINRVLAKPRADEDMLDFINASRS